jgi:hypothetical protein
MNLLLVLEAWMLSVVNLDFNMDNQP